MKPKSTKKCPACGSLISMDAYNRIIGVQHAQQAAVLKAKRDLAEIAEERRRMNRELKEAKAAGKRAIKDALKQGIDKERRRATRLALAVKDRDEQIGELKKQLASGSTPSLEGLDLEKVVLDRLKQAFGEDEFLHTGKGGDILHTVISGGEAVGRIVYELKKTASFQKAYLAQTMAAVRSRNARYGVLVPTRFPKGSDHFQAFGEILVVHPDGVIHLAALLRESMIQLYVAGKSDKKRLAMGEQVLKILASAEFKNNFNQALNASVLLQAQLNDEVGKHVKAWRDRTVHQAKLYQSVTAMGDSLNSIALGKGTLHAQQRLASGIVSPRMGKQFIELPLPQSITPRIGQK